MAAVAGCPHTAHACRLVPRKAWGWSAAASRASTAAATLGDGPTGSRSPADELSPTNPSRFPVACAAAFCASQWATAAAALALVLAVTLPWPAAQSYMRPTAIWMASDSECPARSKAWATARMNGSNPPVLLTQLLAVPRGAVS